MSSTSIITSLGNPVVQNLKQTETQSNNWKRERETEREMNSPCLAFGTWFFCCHILLNRKKLRAQLQKAKNEMIQAARFMKLKRGI